MLTRVWKFLPAHAGSQPVNSELHDATVHFHAGTVFCHVESVSGRWNTIFIMIIRN